ncbi:MAG TPA: hypothetical protein VJS92_06175 [Candidatus Polarisedimenticolaceae bacterium]|nr:hypothetical protein [Candidatus Polarisedimenticolaceae bacterium]
MLAGPKANRATLAAATFALLAAIAFDLTPFLRGPAPYPSEWRWPLRAGAIDGWSGVQALAIGGALIGLLLVSRSSAFRRRPGAAACAMLGTATLLGAGLQLAMLGFEPGSAADLLVARTVDPGFTSYYTVATNEAADVRSFLDRYAERLPRLYETAHHASTHPPGAVLFYRAILSACATLPALGPPALLAPLVLMLLAAATCWPVAALARALGAAPLAAARVGVLWTLVPGPLLMVPELDGALALPVAGCAALLASGGSGWARPLAAGAVAGCALFVSYGSAAFLLVAGVAALGLDRPDPVWLARRVGLVAAGVLAVWSLPLLAGYDAISAARTSLAIHRLEYTAPRSWPLWIGFNLWDFVVFLGLPPAWLFLRGLVGKGGDAAQRWCGIVAGGTLLLDVSGLARGEVGRLWIPLMPLLLVAGATAEHDEPTLADAGALLLASALVLRLTWIVP